ncbi:MAG TPA: MFS transporter [Bacilli bacterium]|nr:MFS transporter [Bacilli bacterium]
MTTTNTPTAKSAVWRDRNFLTLWLGTVLSALGDSAYFILIGWAVYDLTGSESALGTVLTVAAVPRLVFMLIGGVTADRFSKKAILSLSVCARTTVLTAFALFLWLGDQTYLMYAVYPMAVLFGIVDAFFWPARSSIMPLLVPAERLAVANSIMETSSQISMVIGPLLASLLLFLPSYPLMFAVLGAIFLLSAPFLMMVRLRHATEKAVDEDSSEAQPPVTPSIFRDLKEGITYSMSMRILAIIMLLSLFFNVLLVGPMNVGLPVLVSHLGMEGSAYGSLEGAVGIGAIIGSVLVGVCNGFRGRFPLICLFIALMGTSFGAVAFMEALPFGLAMMLLTGITLSLVNIPIMTFVQTIVDTEKLGRVSSLMAFMSNGLTPVSYAVSAFLLQGNLISSQSLFLIGGGAVTVFGLLCFLIRDFREAEQHPKWQAVGQTQAAAATTIES